MAKHSAVLFERARFHATRVALHELSHYDHSQQDIMVTNKVYICECSQVMLTSMYAQLRIIATIH